MGPRTTVADNATENIPVNLLIHQTVIAQQMTSASTIFPTPSSTASYRRDLPQARPLYQSVLRSSSHQFADAATNIIYVQRPAAPLASDCDEETQPAERDLAFGMAGSMNYYSSRTRPMNNEAASIMATSYCASGGSGAGRGGVCYIAPAALSAEYTSPSGGRRCRRSRAGVMNGPH